MKRYEVTLTAGITTDFPNGWVPYMHECVDGEWVRYSDVEKEMKRIWGDIMPPPSEMIKALGKGA